MEYDGMKQHDLFFMNQHCSYSHKTFKVTSALCCEILLFCVALHVIRLPLWDLSTLDMINLSAEAVKYDGRLLDPSTIQEYVIDPTAVT